MKAGTPLPPPDPAELPAEPVDDEATPAPALPDLSHLPVAGITRRRLAFLAAALVSAWIVIVFAHQVGEASAAAARVEAMRADNAALADRLAALEREKEEIQRQEWIAQQARAYELGSGREIPFAVEGTTALPPDAPGSAAVRLGARDDHPSPIETWLSLLFGPSSG